MTLAVCTACGQYKFGALVRCERCSHLPVTALDKAKAMTVSDHNFGGETLEEFKNLIEAGTELPYDPVSLASSSAPFQEEAYFEENFDFTNGMLSCKRCNCPFEPTSEEVFCPRCMEQANPLLSVCMSCDKVYDSSGNFCQKCGNRLIQRSERRALEVGREIAVSVRRILSNKDPLEQCELLLQLRGQLPSEDLASSQHEFENFAMYTAVMALRQFVESGELLVAIVKEMVEIYRASFVIQGVREVDSQQIPVLYMRRFDEYDRVVARNPDQWMLLLADTVTKNCYGVERHLKAAMEMVLVTGFFLKVMQDVCRSILMGREAPSPKTG